MTREEVAGAVARGYGTTANMHKELDADLVTGITNEVMALLQSLSQEAVREEVLVALEEAVDYALDVWMDRQFPYEQRTYVDGTFAEAMTELGKQRTALKREPNAAGRESDGEIAHAMSMTDDGPAPAAPGASDD